MDPETKFLLVEDDDNALKLLKRHLNMMGFTNLLVARDGGDAILKLQTGNIQFIICDWYMPFMDGLELLKTIRKSEKSRNIPFLMISAETKRENIQKAIQEGANGYIVKPYSHGVLEKQIESLLADQKKNA
jgi:two-component system chemotaxis response regulator CheY